MVQRKSSKPTKTLTYSYAVRSYRGYLEGTGKSRHTIGSYLSDLKTFQRFLSDEFSPRLVDLSNIRKKDVDRYSDFLKKEGLRINTRRRKLLTVRRFLKYLTLRKKVKKDFSQLIPVPYKMERVPFTIDSDILLKRIIQIRPTNDIQIRNRALLWTLAETGVLVSEVRFIQYSHFHYDLDGKAHLDIQGKAPRTIEISPELFDAIEDLKTIDLKKKYVFIGYNKFGPLGSPITARGIELLVKAYAPFLQIPQLVPRTFRHSLALKWLREGVSSSEIRKRLGLKTDYAFQVFAPLLK